MYVTLCLTDLVTASLIGSPSSQKRTSYLITAWLLNIPKCYLGIMQGLENYIKILVVAQIGQTNKESNDVAGGNVVLSFGLSWLPVSPCFQSKHSA